MRDGKGEKGVKRSPMAETLGKGGGTRKGGEKEDTKDKRPTL